MSLDVRTCRSVPIQTRKRNAAMKAAEITPETVTPVENVAPLGTTPEATPKI